VLELAIPGWGYLELNHLVMDYNGTLALDGKVLEGVVERLDRLRHRLELHLVTGDTYGNVKSQASGLPVALTILQAGEQAQEKADYVRRLGGGVVALGNGRNDVLMLRAADLGLAVLGPEGAYRGTLDAADVVVPGPLTALDLLLEPRRLVATLRG
jgi:P-type E1-E2 ATPase